MRCSIDGDTKLMRQVLV